MCVDMRQANKAVKRERHDTPTVKELIGDLNGARVFSKMDFNQGHNHLELEKSRYITTFSTHESREIQTSQLWNIKRC